MATLVPPPSKRQKLEAAARAEKELENAQIPDDLGSVRIQFVDQSSGQATGPVVAVPVKDATVGNLEMLLNTLQGKVSPLRACHLFDFRDLTLIDAPCKSSPL